MYKELIDLAKKTKPDIRSDVRPLLRVRGYLGNYIYYDVCNGSMHDNPNECRRYYVFYREGKQYLLFSVYYPDSDISGLHRIELNVQKYKVHTTENHNIPVLIDTVWFNREKEIVYQNGENFIPVLKKSDFPNSFFCEDIQYEYDEDKSIGNMMKQLYKQNSPILCLDARRGSVVVTQPCRLKSFLFSKEPVKRETKKQKLIDSLSADLKDPYFLRDSYCCRNLISMMPVNTTRFVDIMAVEKTADGCVIRDFFVDFYSADLQNIQECRRIFVNKKDVIYSYRNNRGEYIVTRKKPEFKFSCTVWFKKDVIDGTCLEYIKGYLDMFKSYSLGSLFLAFLENPVIEKVLKSGMVDYVKVSVEEAYNGPTHVMERLSNNIGLDFAAVCDQPNLNGFTRMTEKQRRKILERFPLSDYVDSRDGSVKVSCTPISQIRQLIAEVYLEGDIRPLDDITFDSVLDIYEIVAAGSVKNVYYGLESMRAVLGNIGLILVRLCNIHGAKMDCVSKMLCQIVKPESMSDLLGAYCDYLYMYDEIGDASRHGFTLMFNTSDELWDAHNRIINVYIKKKNQINEEKFISNCKNASKYEYEDDDYTVICPDNPQQVESEGQSLHHCVSSYIPRVANGETNIMFIRKKDTPDKPFFTVQVNNDGQVVQIHGQQNRNVDTEPGLDAFVKKWISDKGLFSAGYNDIL